MNLRVEIDVIPSAAAAALISSLYKLVAPEETGKFFISYSSLSMHALCSLQPALSFP
jgi:hypothetical protein